MAMQIWACTTQKIQVCSMILLLQYLKRLWDKVMVGPTNYWIKRMKIKYATHLL